MSGPGSFRGDEHAENPPPSIWHSNVAVPSVLENVNDADVTLVGFAGVDTSDVEGAVVSTVNDALAGEAST